MSKILELVWPGKGQHVLRNPETGNWEFHGSDPLPPRPLIEIEAFGDEKQKPTADENSNLLIKGENLYALQALSSMRSVRGKVKLIYIDPPFNRGKEDFDPYDDNFTHSVWLSMMQERLLLAKTLLTDDGLIFVHIGTQEVGRLMVLMDEIFAHNFMNLISVTTNDPSGFKATANNIFSTVNFLIVYANNKSQTVLHRVFIEREFDWAYSRYLLNPEDHYSKWQWKSLFEYVANMLGNQNRREAESALGQDGFKQEVLDFAMQNAERVFRTAAIQGGARAKRLATIEKSKRDREKVFVHPDEDLEDFYILNGEQILFYHKRTVEISGGRRVPGQLLTDVWTDISWTGIANEGGVKLKEGKKPELLLQRVLELGSRPGDLVLDFFAGSGTTGAVALKMGRRWIMVELNSQADELCVPRLKRVINGEDQTGISKAIGWKGSGGFRLLEVGAPLMITDPETLLPLLNPAYKNGALVRAVCHLEGFELTGDAKYLHGRNGEHFAHVTEDTIDDGYLRRLFRKLPQGCSLTVYVTHAPRGLNMLPGLTVKRMQIALVKPYLTPKKRNGN